MLRTILTVILLLGLTIKVFSQDTLSFIVKPYMQYSTQSELSILWETTLPASSTVKYGKAAFDVPTTPLTEIATLDGQRKMHEVKLEGLSPETNYFWQTISVAANGDTLKSALYSFKTAVKDSSGYAFALVGDSQFNSKTPWAWSVISKEVWKKRPHFVVHAGDLVDWGPKKTDWTEHFFPGGQELMARVPMYTVLGNHEGDADLYYQYMVNPAPEYRYTFKYGNAEFFMIDTNRDVSEGSPQFNWLEQALAHSNAMWKFVIHHHPPYSSESDDHGNTFKVASTMGTKARNLVPLFEKYSVDFCLFGHTHVYERTWPLKDNRINEENGVIYINSGGAGGGLETFAPTRNWFTLELQEGHHFCLFNVFEGTLYFKAIDHEGKVFDQFELHKETPNQKQASLVEPPAPIINSDVYVFEKETKVTIDAGFDHLSVYYTTDGSSPSAQSTRYTESFKLNESGEIKAIAIGADGQKSRTVSKSFIKMAPIPAAKTTSTQPGLAYRYFEGNWEENRADYFTSNTPKKEGILPSISFSSLGEIEAPYWGIIIEGYLEVPETKTYTFYALDSRGLEITLDQQPMIISDGERQTIKSMVLEKGKHQIKIKSFQRTWRQSISFGYYDPILGRIPFKPFNLSH